MKFKEGSTQGEKNCNHRLTEEIVRLIRKQTLLTQEELAALYDVDVCTIQRAVSRKSWRHVK